jgi:hypothetical protein
MSEQPDDFREFQPVEGLLAYRDGLRTKPIAAKLLVGSMEPYRRAVPQVRLPWGGISDLPIEINPYLKPDQWVMLDAKGTIIAAGNGVE